MAGYTHHGIIFGISIIYNTNHVDTITHSINSELNNESTNRYYMIRNSIKKGDLQYFIRHSSLPKEHTEYFIGEKRSDLSDKIISADHKIKNYYKNHRSIPSVLVFDAKNIGLDSEIPRIETLLRDAGIKEYFFKHKIKIFFS